MQLESTTQHSQSNSPAAAGFAVSILGLILSYGLLSVIGLVISLLALREEPRGLAIAGAIIGFIGWY